MKHGKNKTFSKRLDASISRLYTGPDYNGWSRSEASFWAAFTGYVAIMLGLFYLVATYYFDKE